MPTYVIDLILDPYYISGSIPDFKQCHFSLLTIVTGELPGARLNFEVKLEQNRTYRFRISLPKS